MMDLGPTGGNMRPAAISSIIFFSNGLVAYCPIDDHSAEFPKNPSTGNFLPDLPCKSGSSGRLHRQSASAEMENGIRCLAVASYRMFPPAGPSNSPRVPAQFGQGSACYCLPYPRGAVLTRCDHPLAIGAARRVGQLTRSAP